MKIYLYALAALYLCSVSLGIQEATIGWTELIATDGVKFTARNAFAACTFKGFIWLTGGRSDLHAMYNLLDSTKEADVWKSEHGNLWSRIDTLQGDYYKQNADVIQPGPIAPWYERFGHTLNAIDTDGDGLEDYMILMGGFSSSASNDMWVTVDGETWVYSGDAAWDPRGFHATATLAGKLYLIGGTPLNNEVWVMDPQKDFKQKPRIAPLTRAMYMSYTYEVNWKNLAMNSAWAPRVGMSFINQWYFNASANLTVTDSTERLMMIGGYGGWREQDPRYDGVHCFADVWSFNGTDWLELNNNASFGRRAFAGVGTLHDPADPRRDYAKVSNNISARVYMFGGGNFGFDTSSSKIINKVDGKLDAWYTRDGRDWFQINYQEGGGKTVVQLYSTQEWSQAIVDTVSVFVGLWGHSVVAFNTTNGFMPPDRLILIAGDRTSGGSMSNIVFESKKGLFCDREGIPCSYKGSCGRIDFPNDNDNTGCICNFPYIGEHCESTLPLESAAHMTRIIYFMVSVFAFIAVAASSFY